MIRPDVHRPKSASRRSIPHNPTVTGEEKSLRPQCQELYVPSSETTRELPPLSSQAKRRASVTAALQASTSMVSGLISIPILAVKDAFTGGIRHSYFEHRESYPTEEKAASVLTKAKRKLKNPNNWKMFGPRLSAAKFQLYDGSQARPKNGKPSEGDRLKIHLPDGLGPSWVEIEKIRHGENFAEIVVRPTSDPRKPNDPTVRHLFSRDTTNVFRVAREGREVSVSVEGRDEKANLDGHFVDRKLAKIRTAGAWMGAKKPQWNAFTQKLLTHAEEASSLTHEISSMAPSEH